MSTERRLLASALSSRKACDVITRHVPEEDFSALGRNILDHISAYYERDKDAQSVDGETLSALVRQGVQNPKHRDKFDTLISEIVSTDVSSANVAEEILGARRESLGTRMAGQTMILHATMYSYV